MIKTLLIKSLKNFINPIKLQTKLNTTKAFLLLDLIRRQLDFVAMACESDDMTSADQQRLIHVISENGWREDACIRHLTSKTASASKNSSSKQLTNENIERPPGEFV